MQEELDKLDELGDVALEIRRCLNFFQDETETSLWIDDVKDNVGYLVDEATGNKYRMVIEKE